LPDHADYLEAKGKQPGRQSLQLSHDCVVANKPAIKETIWTTSSLPATQGWSTEQLAAAQRVDRDIQSLLVKKMKQKKKPPCKTIFVARLR